MAVHKEETMLEKLNAVRPLFHLIVALTMQFVALSIVTPAIIGVIVEAVCPPGHAECGRVIFLSGFQQMSVGIGAMAMTPIIGSLSDSYGRKPLLTITCAANILPLALLAYRRDAAFVYAYFVMRIIIDAGDSGNTCVLLAAVADTVEDKLKGPAFGVILGSLAAGCLLGTSVAKGLSIDQVFKVAPMLAASAALYLTAFVRETNPCTAIVPALGDSPKQKWWRKLMNTKTSVVEAGRLVMNRYSSELDMFNNFIFDLVSDFAS
jgi:MFS family permease